MIKFAVIGTNWITQKFVQAAHETQSMQLAAVYSRNLDSAAQFAQKFNVETTYDSLDALASDSIITAVYIASPNSMHCEQSILMMKHGKHVIF
jgi:predicted dehydrogenase